jgi:hypothetical protein
MSRHTVEQAINPQTAQPMWGVRDNDTGLFAPLPSKEQAEHALAYAANLGYAEGM